jgi:hypothetical protein
VSADSNDRKALESSAGGGIGIVAAVSEAESSSVLWSTLGGGLELFSFSFVSTYRKKIIVFSLMRRVIITSYKCLLYTLLYSFDSFSLKNLNTHSVITLITNIHR